MARYSGVTTGGAPAARWSGATTGTRFSTGPTVTRYSSGYGGWNGGYRYRHRGGGFFPGAVAGAVIGGALDHCIRVNTISGAMPTVGWTFKDVFAKPTLGTYH